VLLGSCGMALIDDWRWLHSVLRLFFEFLFSRDTCILHSFVIILGVAFCYQKNFPRLGRLSSFTALSPSPSYEYPRVFSPYGVSTWTSDSTSFANSVKSSCSSLCGIQLPSLSNKLVARIGMSERDNLTS
jgi:hypothetical protein